MQKKDNEKMVKRCYLLPENIIKKIDAKHKKTGISRNKITEFALIEYLNKEV